MRTLLVALFSFVFVPAAHPQSGVDSMLRVLPGQKGMQRIANLGNIGWELGMRDPLKALPYGNESLALAEAMQDSTAIATAANDLAITEFRLGHLQRAVQLNQRALRIRLLAKDQLGAAASHSKIAVAFTNMMLFDSALVHNYAAAAIYGVLNETQRLAQVRGNIGNLYQQMGDLEMAEKVLRATVSQLRPTGATYALAITIGQLCQVLGQRKKTDEAYTTGLEALALFDQLGMAIEVAAVNNELGMISRNRGDAAAGLAYYRKALAMAAGTNDLAGSATYGMNVANVLFDIGRVKESLPFYARSLYLCRQQGYADQHMSLLGGYIKAMEASGDLHTAMTLQTELIALKDSVYKSERLAVLSEMQVKYETQRTENELLQAQARTEKQREQISQQRLRILALGVGLLFLVGIAGSLVYVQRLRHRAQLSAQLIAERTQGSKAMVQRTDEERKRIAGELHDGVGQLLTGLKYRIEAVVATDPRLKDMLSLADEASKEVRDIAHRMMPRALGEMGLVPALTDMLNRSLSLPGMTHRFEHHGMEQRLPMDVETGVYRIAQELINNILKHAHAHTVEVQLLRNRGAIVLIVEDDGVGIDPAKATQGLGMRSLQERARILNGTIDLGANGIQGTVVTMRLPTAEQPAA